MGLLQVNSCAGYPNSVASAWQTLMPIFGPGGPARMVVYVVNGTAPSYITGPAVLVISNTATVDFVVSPIASAATVLGDPSFSGFHGQPSYQAHGIPGEVLNVLTAQSLQLNALISFMDKGEALSGDRMARVRSQAASALSSPRRLPLAQPWTHPGTYLTRVGLKAGAFTLLLQAGGSASSLTVTVVEASHRRLLLPTESLEDDGAGVWLSLDDSHRLRVRHPLLRFSVVSSDGFFQPRGRRASLPGGVDALDGLLGQSANQQWKAGKSD